MPGNNTTQSVICTFLFGKLVFVFYLIVKTFEVGKKLQFLFEPWWVRLSFQLCWRGIYLVLYVKPTPYHCRGTNSLSLPLCRIRHQPGWLPLPGRPLLTPTMQFTVQNEAGLNMYRKCDHLKCS